MRVFQCQRCSQPIFFENTTCESCGCQLGFLNTGRFHREPVLSAVVENENGCEALADPRSSYNYCQNRDFGVCNWLIPAGNALSLCQACQLNRAIPNLDNLEHLQAWQSLELAKHRLVYSLLRFEVLPPSKSEAPETGLAFDFLSNEPQQDTEQPQVQTGHAQGIVTIDIAEADPAHRERTRTEMAEAYRTVLGHFRHEVGHYYWERLVQPHSSVLASFREHFGDERADYSQSLQQHYDQGPPSDWRQGFVSAYASAHPWEDWAETWAHYLHIVDTLETAYSFGLSLNVPFWGPGSLQMQANFDPYQHPDFDRILTTCLPLTLAVNSLNRSMGQPDLYPFVLPDPVVTKLRYVHQLLQGSSS